MKIFPAIDIKDKKCVRLIRGDFENKTEYEMSPLEQAGKYKDNGFKNLHIVDLDGALTGEPINTDIIQDIIGKFDLKIEIGGGLRNFETIQKYIDAGVEKVILGSAAIKDRRFFYTDINRDGTKQSPNFEETQKVADISNCPVVISGGVSSINDIKKAKNLNNIEGVIVGKAIYDGDIKLDELAKEIDA
jgi:phosphoribosylformimino-5-aminoimidazole carboxamide ribotide isomerase